MQPLNYNLTLHIPRRMGLLQPDPGRGWRTLTCAAGMKKLCIWTTVEVLCLVTECRTEYLNAPCFSPCFSTSASHLICMLLLVMGLHPQQECRQSAAGVWKWSEDAPPAAEMEKPGQQLRAAWFLGFFWKVYVTIWWTSIFESFRCKTCSSNFVTGPKRLHHNVSMTSLSSSFQHNDSNVVFPLLSDMFL